MSKSNAAIYLIAEKLLRFGVGALVTALIARSLGPDNFGGLAVALGTVAVFSAATNMGADHINTAELSRRTSDEFKQYLISGLVARIILGTIVTTLLILCAQLNLIDGGPLAIVLSFLVMTSAFTILRSGIEAQSRFETVAICGAIAFIIGSLTKACGVVLGQDAYFFAAAFLIEAIAQIMLWIYAIGKFWPVKISIDYTMNDAASYFKHCFPTAISAILLAIYFRVELFLLNWILGQASVGLWYSLTLFVTPWALLAASILSIANNRVAKQDPKSSMFSTSYIQLIRKSLMFAALAAICTCVAAPIIVPALFGTDYEEIVPAIWISSLAIFPMFLGAVQEISIAQRGNTRVVLWKVLIGIPISAVFVAIFTSKLGLIGAAIGMVSSYWITGVFLNYFFDREFLSIQIRALRVK